MGSHIFGIGVGGVGGGGGGKNILARRDFRY